MLVESLPIRLTPSELANVDRTIIVNEVTHAAPDISFILAEVGRFILIVSVDADAISLQFLLVKSRLASVTGVFPHEVIQKS